MAESWEFEDKKDMLSFLIGGDFGQKPEEHLHDIRASKKRIAERIIKDLSLKQTDRVLEIGSGMGLMSSVIAPKVNHLYCCDVSQSFLDIATKECAKLTNTSFHHIQSAQLNFLENSSLDAAFSYNVFIHMNLFDIYWYFQELHRVLKPGGRFYFDIAAADDLKPGNLPPLFLEMAHLYKDNPAGINCLVQWSSTHVVENLALHFGFNVHRPHNLDNTLHLLQKNSSTTSPAL